MFRFLFKDVGKFENSRLDRMFVAEDLLRHLIRAMPELSVKDRTKILSVYADMPRFRRHTMITLRNGVKLVDKDVQEVDEADINNMMHVFHRFDEAGEDVSPSLLHTLRKGVFDTTKQEPDLVNGEFLCEFVYKNTLFPRGNRMARAQFDLYGETIAKKLNDNLLSTSPKVLELLLPVLDSNAWFSDEVRAKVGRALLERIL